MHAWKRMVATPAARVLTATLVMSAFWGAMIFSQGVRGPQHSADWDLMSEVGRRLALGDTLYVDTMDQKGPLCYLTYALEWLIAGRYGPAFVLSNIAVWLMLTVSSALTAKILEEASLPWYHPLAQAALNLAFIVPHVGCLEEWLVPFGLLSALWVRRLVDGRKVSGWCWALVGVFAAYALWSKFTCCAQFVFVLGYAASRVSLRELRRPLALALGACLLVSGVVLLWLWQAGSLWGMVEHYIHAATGGYAERMSMFKYLQNSNPSTTHVSSFFVGLPLSILTLVSVTVAAKKGRRAFVLVGGLALMACCFSTFVGYYRFQLSTLVVLGVRDIPECLFFHAIEDADHARQTVRRTVIIPAIAVSAVAIGANVHYTCKGTPGSVDSARRMVQTLRSNVGNSKSVLVWQFDHTWAYAELGIDHPYATPSRYNASQDLWDATAGKDAAAHRWEYLVVAVSSGVKAGDHVTLAGESFEVLAVASNMAVVDGGAGAQPLSCRPYRNP